MSSLKASDDYELVQCSNADCDHEYVRPAEGRRTLPCIQCHSEMVATPRRLFDLDAMRQSLEAALTRSEELLEYELPWSSITRARREGRRDGYREALEMLGVVIAGEGAGAGADRLSGPREGDRPAAFREDLAALDASTRSGL